MLKPSLGHNASVGGRDEAARELAGHVRDWFEGAAERVLDRLGSGQSERALAGDRDGQEEKPDLATRMRAAWEARQSRSEVQGAATPERERETSQGLAARLRKAVAGIDRDTLADRAVALRESREAEERHQAQEAAQERELVRQREIELEKKSIAERDRGLDYGL